MEPKRLTLLRYESSADGTFGVLLLGRRWICHTLEPQNRSGGYRQALKAGRYPLTYEYSPKFRRKLPTISAMGRVGLRIHAGNTKDDTSGCVIVGESRGTSYLLRSKVALERVCELVLERDINELEVVDYEQISNGP